MQVFNPYCSRNQTILLIVSRAECDKLFCIQLLADALHRCIPAYSEKNRAMPDDLDLIRRVLRREESALGELYDRYGNAVYSLALRVLRDAQRAEEITQDVFLRVWNQPEKWDSSKGKLVSWLLTVTRYAAIDRLRAEQRQPAVIDSPLEDDSPIADPEGWNPAEWQDGQELRKILAQLPAEQQQVIQLAFYGGLSHREMADKLGIPFGTVKTRLRLGLQKMRQLWMQPKDEMP